MEGEAGLQAEGSVDNDIVIYHIGGEGSYGPIETIIQRFPKNVRLVLFEARTDTDDLVTAERLDSNGVRMRVINLGVDERSGTTSFNVNKLPLSSSLLDPSPIALNEAPLYLWEYYQVHTWGENTELDRKITVETISIDEMIAKGLAPPPDIISIDAQGAELRILQGARQALSRHCLSVVSEVEFFEIYDRQGLFDDQMHLLGEHGFRLVNIYNQQEWHPAPTAGTGFLTVGEAVFVRFLHEYPHLQGDPRRCYSNPERLSDQQLVRLMAIALGFNLYSYVYVVAGMLKKRSPERFEQLRSSPLAVDACALYDYMESNRESYEKYPRFFVDTILRA